MIIKSIRLKNIRTYEEETVEFPDGIILFEGGIGAGKSTLLLAIEFALFGIGNEKGTTLLSIGKHSGSVELEFETGGKNVKVFRSLERSRRSAGSVHQGVMVPASVKQGECWIEVDGVRSKYSPKEMKEQVLKLLSYNEPADPKAKSVIFRYAVYTPQEEMKEILSQPPEVRLQTIRKALRIEDYKIAKENAKMIASDLRREAELIRKNAERLPQVEGEIRSIEESLPELEDRLEEIVGKIERIEKEIGRLDQELDRLERERLRFAKEAQDVNQIDSDLRKVQTRISDLEGAIAKKRRILEDLQRRITELQIGEAPPMTEGEVEERLSVLKAKLSEQDSELGRLKSDLETTRTLVMKGFCPTCKRPIDGTEFGAHLHSTQARYEGAKKEREETAQEIRELEDKRKSIINYGRKAEQLKEWEGRATELEDEIFDAKQDLEGAKDHQKELTDRKARAAKAADQFKAITADYEGCRRAKEGKDAERNDLLKEKVKVERDIEVNRRRLEDLKIEVKSLEAEQKRAEMRVWHSEWLVKYFAAALERIEVTVMKAVRREFDEEFGRWFSYLVEDPSKGVRIDEDFTPLVTQDSYEQELGNLSGGERTSLALAYRIALNRVVQRNSSIGSDLLILDEPTDGFSKDQIGKMGDLLRELRLKQAVIVSHERELEGAVDHIFRIQKEGGKSRVHALAGQ